MNRPRTPGELFEALVILRNIKQTAAAESLAWIKGFLLHAGIHTAEDIRTATEAAYRLHLRARHANPDENARETLRTPRQTAVSGGDHEECAAFAIALGGGLGLSADLGFVWGDKLALALHIDDVRILPF